MWTTLIPFNWMLMSRKVMAVTVDSSSQQVNCDIAPPFDLSHHISRCTSILLPIFLHPRTIHFTVRHLGAILPFHDPYPH
jgi:hypothetical protein